MSKTRKPATPPAEPTGPWQKHRSKHAPPQGMPTVGGSYRRDKNSGAIERAPAPDAPASTTTTADTPAQ